MHQIHRLADESFEIKLDVAQGGITSLKRSRDVYDTEYIMPGGSLGEITVRYRDGSGQYWERHTHCLNAFIRETGDGRITFSYEDRAGQMGDSTTAPADDPLVLSQGFELAGGVLTWSINLTNRSEMTLEIDDLMLPLLFNTRYARDPKESYTNRLVKHSLICGDESFVFWMRPNGVGPYLLMTPAKDTSLEYFDANREDARFGTAHSGSWEGVYRVYIHSRQEGQSVDGHWPLPHSGRTLAAYGNPGDSVTYNFNFRWVDGYDGVRDALYEEGLSDISIVPGMVVPNDLFARISVRTKNPVTSVTSSHPDETEVTYLGTADEETHLFEVRFSRLGENVLTFHKADGRQRNLEFFSTEPLETLVKKRSRFIVEKQQHKDASKWYDGLFSLWDMESGQLRSPDDTGGLPLYMVSGSDDPTLGKAPLVAEKNVAFPDRNDIQAVEYYLEHFVWGKLQRRDDEHPHPYGIYGSPNWFENRNSDVGYDSGGHGKEHMWRTFDYTHLIMLYYRMYQIAKFYPDLTRYLDRHGYLTRAYGTAKAYFTIPYNIKMGKNWDFRGWCDWAYKQGNFHEKYIIPLIDALTEEGRIQEANWLRAEWEKKVKYFLYDHPYPFGSEMYFDSTAFESTHAIAHYALTHPLQPDENLWVDKNSGVVYSHPNVDRMDAIDFMHKQIQYNIACRGWLETAYYYLGSDYRASGNSTYTLSYMSQMGGWAVLDYGLQHAGDDFWKYLRLGYASLLSSWALVNSGTPSTDFGYWYPNEHNDGAAAWGFEPQKVATPWLGKRVRRGAWPYDGEIDHGHAAAIESARTVVTVDPVFGLFAYGGLVEEVDGKYSILPKDGVRRSIWVRTPNLVFQAILERDRFSDRVPVGIFLDGSEIRFVVECSHDAPHTTRLELFGSLEGTYRVTINGSMPWYHEFRSGEKAVIELPLPRGQSFQVLISRQGHL